MRNDFLPQGGIARNVIPPPPPLATQENSEEMNANASSSATKRASHIYFEEQGPFISAPARRKWRAPLRLKDANVRKHILFAVSGRQRGIHPSARQNF